MSITFCFDDKKFDHFTLLGLNMDQVWLNGALGNKILFFFIQLEFKNTIWMLRVKSKLTGFSFEVISCLIPTTLKPNSNCPLP